MDTCAPCPQDMSTHLYGHYHHSTGEGWNSQCVIMYDIVAVILVVLVGFNGYLANFIAS